MNDTGLWAERRLEAGICLAVAAGTIFYLWLWPRDLFGFDEGLYLYEAKRLLDGDVFYRDIFEIITPGAFYLMAGAFWLFGTDIDVARLAMAILHAALAVVLYLSCRAAGVRRELAALPALLHLTIAYPALSIASPHWISTFLQATLLYLFLRAPAWGSQRWLVLVGLLTGTLILVQQPKGAAMALGLAILLLGDALVDPAHRSRRFAVLRSRLAVYTASVLGLAMPVLFLQVAASGLEATWHALIAFPMREYPGFGQCRSWGYAGPLKRRSHLAFPTIVSRLPGVLVLGGLQTVAASLRGDAGEMRRFAALSVIPALAIAAMYYCPNSTHLAIAAPLCLPLAAVVVERILGALPARLGRLLGAGLATALALLLVAPMRTRLSRQRAQAPVSHETAFGRVDLKFTEEALLVDAIRERTRPGDEIFVYPTYPSLYLMTGTKNPTRFQVLIHNYTPPEQREEVIRVLEERRVALIVVQAFFVDWRGDPIIRHLVGRYHRVMFAPPPAKGLPAFALYARNSQGS